MYFSLYYLTRFMLYCINKDYAIIVQTICLKLFVWLLFT